MIGVRLYAAPVPGGAALVAPPSALSDLRDAAYLLRQYPGPLRLDLLVGELLAGDEVEAQATLFLRRAAAAATMPAALQRVGLWGPWYVALVVWGWLLVLGAAQNPLQAAAGLWLALGFPWARAAFRRRAWRWSSQGAIGLRLALEDLEVRQVPHAGLAELADVLRQAEGDQAGACRTAAARCPTAGLPELAPFYRALAADGRPDGLWGILPRAAAPELEGELPRTSSIPTSA